MPIRFNDTDRIKQIVMGDATDRTETPHPKEPPIAHVESDTSQPTGPSNTINFSMGETAPGHPKYLTGPPLSELNSIPFRGSGMAAHALDIDATQDDWNNHAGPAESTGGEDETMEYWQAPEPIVVKIVEMPLETEEKYSRIISLFGTNEQYTFTGVGTLDSNPVRTVLPKDDTRRSATIYAVPSPQASAGVVTLQYAFLISNDQQCLTGILLGSGLANAPQSVTLLGKSPVFARIVPLAAYDGTKTNAYSLAAVSETSVLGQKRVS